MKIKVTIGENDSDMLFDKITIVTKERTFDFANAVIGNCMAEVTRYCIKYARDVDKRNVSTIRCMGQNTINLLDVFQRSVGPRMKDTTQIL